MKKKYKINIGVFLVVGAFFLIVGLVLLSESLTIRKNLKNIYDENVDISKLKEGDYVTINNSVKTLGYWHNDLNKYITGMYDVAGLVNSKTYFAINYNGNNDKYVSVVFETRSNKNIDIETDDNGYILFLNDNEIFKESLDFKVVKINSEHRESMSSIKEQLKWGNKGTDITEDNNEIDFYDEIALEVIDYDKEREVLVWALSLLFCGVILIIASKPWSIVEEKYEPIREFNIVYNEKITENDIAVAAELARSLRLDVLRYEADYRELKKNIRNNVIAVVMSGLIAYGIRYIGVLYLLTIILLLKLIVSIVILIFNNDTYFTRNFMKAIGREAIKSAIKDRECKIAKCDEVIRSGIYNVSETY